MTTTSKSQSFSVPIRLKKPAGRTWTYLGLNSLLKWHYRTYDSAKKQFKFQIKPAIDALSPVTGAVKTTFEIFYPTGAAIDVDNYGAVVAKFTHDALVEYGILQDDNHKFVKQVNLCYGGKDKENPRCEVTIEPLEI